MAWWGCPGWHPPRLGPRVGISLQYARVGAPLTVRTKNALRARYSLKFSYVVHFSYAVQPRSAHAASIAPAPLGKQPALLPPGKPPALLPQGKQPALLHLGKQLAHTPNHGAAEELDARHQLLVRHRAVRVLEVEAVCSEGAHRRCDLLRHGFG